MISAARSRNIRFYLVLQCNSQLHSKYQQQGTTIKNNCQNWVYLNSREKELIEEVQELVGVDPSDPNSHAVSVNDLLGIKKRKKTFIEIVAFVLLCLICLPIIIIISLILLFNLLLGKKVKTESTYDKLDKIMCDKLFCTKG